MPKRSEITCPTCGAQNRAKAAFCVGCGQRLDHIARAKVRPESGIEKTVTQMVEPVFRAVEKAADVVVQGVAGLISKRDAPSNEGKGVNVEASSGPTTIPLSASQPTIPLVSGGSQLTPLVSGAWIDNVYIVFRAYPLTYSNYYDVYELICAECGQRSQPTPGGICTYCQKLLPRYLVHESSDVQSETRGNLNLPSADELLQLSRNQPFIVPHYRVRWLDGRVYVWLPPLAQWRSLAKVKTPASLDQIIIWGQHLVSALAALGNYTYYDPHPSGIEKIIIDGDTVRLADLSSCRQVKPGQSGPIGRDTAFLARILYYLATGSHMAIRGQVNVANAPPTLRAIIERGVRGEYRNLDEMLADLSGRRSKGDYGLSLKSISGKASHPGQVRTGNEDSLIAFEFSRVQESQGVPLGFYLVADGLGGHQGGEIASRTVNKIITERVLHAEVIPGLSFATRRLDETPGNVLTAAIKEANHVLYTQARNRKSDMGTTLTAALVIGETATIANVGDSRTYLLRDKKLQQLTKDHSLVASLVAAGVIQLEEVRTHPQRNQIYRNLGDKAEVEVDIFTQTLQRGDQLLLCSDGLWEMVLDADIARILLQTASPQEACDELIRQANANGGEDNVTAIVVRLE